MGVVARRLAAWVGGLVLAFPAGAVIIDGPNGDANTGAPPDDPGFAYVGNKQGLTAIYVGRGWVLTAAHVSTGPVVLGGVRYEAEPDSRVQLQPAGGAAWPPDLAMFRITPLPPLPSLPIRAEPLSVGAPVTMVGNGTDRGADTTWLDHSGYLWAAPHSLRWGTNHVHAFHPALVILGRETDSFSTEFDAGVGPDECQGSNGDSGGAVFAKDAAGHWELAGVMYAIETFAGQPSAALYENWTYAANLPVYRDQILAIRDAQDVPALPALGLALLAALLGGSGARLLGAGRPG